MNGFSKVLGAEYSSFQVSWARACGQLVLMGAIFIPRRGLVGLLRTRRPGLQAIRASTLFTSNICFFIAIVQVPLAQAGSISLTAPLIVALLAWPVLRERTTPARVAASIIGFLGVLVIIRPGSAVFQPASLLIVVSATCYAIYQLATRKLAGVDPPETSNTYGSVIGGIGMLLVLPFVWQTPDSFADVLMFCSLGLLGGAGHYCIVLAMGHAPANIVSPFQYVQLLGSVLIGWLFFADLPDAMTWLGAAIIVGAGLFLGWSQTRKP
jgi:drug/metabolite transporter (DMT)-like permease